MRRLRESIRQEKEMLAKVREEAYNEAYNEVYNEVVEWDKRRKEAEAKGIEFTEPLPTPPNLSKKT